MTRSNTTLTGRAGEHYVMYRLLNMKRLAALTPDGAEGVDLLLSDPDGSNLKALEIKTSGSEVTVGWRMHSKHENMSRETLFYCFICPGGPDATAPTCWLVPNAVVAKHVAETHQAWLAGKPKRGASRQDGDGRKMHLVCHNPYMEEYPDGWMDRYKEAWHLLKYNFDDHVLFTIFHD